MSIKPIGLASTEEYKGLTTFFFTNGESQSIPTERIEQFVRSQEMNIDSQLVDVTDNGQEISEPYEFQSASDYLDENWGKVTNRFYNEVIIGGN